MDNSSNENLTLSVCIPCINTHIPLLDRCVKSIFEQILHPNEVIISISSVENIKKTTELVDDMLEKYKTKLVIKVLYTSKKKYAGDNRNIAIRASTGDIISFIDADDIMYSNRLYSIMRIFTMVKDCYGILHYFTENDQPRVAKWAFDMNDVVQYQYTNKLHFGHPSFRRRLFSEFRYSSMPRIQDIKFIEQLLPKYISNLRIYKKELSIYKSNDSTLYSCSPSEN